MQEMTSEQAAFLLQTYLPRLKNESRITKSVLLAVPPDRANYRPDPVSKSAMELVRHIASADNFFVETVTTGAFNPGPGVPDTATTPAEVAAWYEERYTRNFEELAKATPAQLLKVVDFRGIVQQPAIGFIVTGLHHTIHHREQLTSYLRAMGAQVPAIYGESYDSAIAKRGVTAWRASVCRRGDRREDFRIQPARSRQRNRRLAERLRRISELGRSGTRMTLSLGRPKPYRYRSHNPRDELVRCPPPNPLPVPTSIRRLCCPDQCFKRRTDLSCTTDVSSYPLTPH